MSKVLIQEGLDVTELLQIRKWDLQASVEKQYLKERRSKNPIIRFLMKFKLFRNILLKKRIKLSFPSHLCSKTDETKIQAVSFVLEDYKGVICVIYEKMDGQSATYVYNKNKFMVCSRNIEIVNKNSNYWKIAEKYKIKEILKNNKNLAIQGEIIGHSENGCGKNIYMSELDFYVFNVVNSRTRQLLTHYEIKDFCKKNGLKMVPILDENYILGTHSVEELLKMAEGKSEIYDVEREGLIFRDILNAYRPIEKIGMNLSFKVMNRNYMMKYCDEME